ncbi:MAG: oligosaccharide flippase family protein [Methanoculleus sp.]|nr:oligosaccharide flippase family protein [Methanoculleus sp.]
MSRRSLFAKVSQWFEEDLFRHLFRNAGTLLSGNLAAWILGLIAYAITARLLGPEQFGIFVLITTFVLIVDALVNFQSWSALIKYGTEALEERRPDLFMGVVKLCSLLDVATACIGTIIAIVAVSLFGQWFAWDAETVQMTAAYSLVILFNLSGVPTGIFRIFKRFKLFAAQNILSAVIKFSGVAIVFVAGAGLWPVLLVWMIATIAGYMLLLIFGWRELYRQGYLQYSSVPLREATARFPGLMGFLGATNLSSSVWLGSREVDTILIGGLAGVEGAGIYKIAKQVSSIPAMLSDPLYQAVYPDLSLLWARREIPQFRRLIIRSGIVAGAMATAIWVGFLLLGIPVIHLLFGAAYTPAYPIAVIYMVAMVVAIFGFPLSPAMASIGVPKLTLWVHLLSTAAYFPLLVVCTRALGLTGAAVAFVAYYLIWSVLMIIIEKNLIEKEESTLIIDQPVAGSD